MAANQPHNNAVWIIAGATASGKSSVAQLLAEQMGCAILSADAMSVYRGMDIGTAKTPPAARGTVKYYGIDLVSPAERCTTGLWLDSARQAVGHSQQHKPGSTSTLPLIVVGGTGLYIKALTDGLEGGVSDPQRRAHWEALLEQEGIAALQQELARLSPGALGSLVDPTNPRRLIRAIEHLELHATLPQSWQARTTPTHVIALRLPRPELHQRITERVMQMFASGLLTETAALRQHYPHWSETARHAIGYAEAVAVLDGTLSHSTAVERVAARTRQLAKRQETWLRHQFNTHWVDINIGDTPAEIADRVAELWRQHGPTTIRL